MFNLKLTNGCASEINVFAVMIFNVEEHILVRNFRFVEYDNIGNG